METISRTTRTRNQNATAGWQTQKEIRILESNIQRKQFEWARYNVQCIFLRIQNSFPGKLTHWTFLRIPDHRYGICIRKKNWFLEICNHWTYSGIGIGFNLFGGLPTYFNVSLMSLKTSLFRLYWWLLYREKTHSLNLGKYQNVLYWDRKCRYTHF